MTIDIAEKEQCWLKKPNGITQRVTNIEILWDLLEGIFGLCYPKCEPFLIIFGLILNQKSRPRSFIMLLKI